MAHRPYRRLWPAAVSCLLTFLVACASTATGAGPHPRTTSAVPVRVLQLNLCDSGIAGCYTGRSTARTLGFRCAAGGAA